MSEIEIDTGIVLYTRTSNRDKTWAARITKLPGSDISNLREWLQLQSLGKLVVRMSEVLFHYMLPFSAVDHFMVISSKDITNDSIEIEDIGVHWIIYPVMKENAIVEEPRHDVVTNPSHYTEGRKYQPKDVIRDWGLNFNLGNVVKYVSRAGRKTDTLEDLKKARQYLDFEIEAMEEENKIERKMDDLEKNIQYLESKFKATEAEIRAKNIR